MGEGKKLIITHLFCVSDLLRAQFIVKGNFEASNSQTTSVSSGRTSNRPTHDTACLEVTLTSVNGLTDGRPDNPCWIPCLLGVGSKKVKCTLVQALRLCTGRTARRGSFLTTALEGGAGSASRAGRSLPPGKTRYPLYRRLGGTQGRSEQVWKI